MIPTTLRHLTKVVGGRMFGKDLTIEHVITDSRSNIPINSLFVALSGNNFDGHDFAIQAYHHGAQALLVKHILPVSCSQIVVANPQLSLSSIAAFVRQQSQAQIIAITGSAGKTTLKEITSCILQQRDTTLSTNKNYNNHTIGVPSTLLRLTHADRFAVIEVGASNLGEISQSAALIQPKVAVINNIAASHLSGFGTLTGVAREKGMLFEHLLDDGIAVINLDSHYLNLWQSHLDSKRIWRFSLNKKKDSDIYITQILPSLVPWEYKCVVHTPLGEAAIKIPLMGKHNLSNALAATAIAMVVGISLKEIQRGLTQIKPIPGRLYPYWLAPGKLIIDDSYNANLGSTLAALEVLKQCPGYRILVMGDMAELGTKSSQYYQKFALEVKHKGIELVFSLGTHSQQISRINNGEHFTNLDTLVARLRILLYKQSSVSILVKGSRSAAMDRVVDALRSEVKPCYSG